MKALFLLCFPYYTAEQSHSNWHKDQIEIYNYNLKTMVLLGMLLWVKKQDVTTKHYQENNELHKWVLNTEVCMHITVGKAPRTF
jgi:hypothetical protein